MKFFAVHLEDMESERFIASTNDQIATWIFLHALCSKQMNSGTISDASTLPERFWSRHSISVDIIKKSSPLWSWSGDDLSVEPYDIEGQDIFEKKVKGGKAGAAKRWKGSENRSAKGGAKGSAKGSANRPNPTQPNPTRPEMTQPSSSPIGDCVSDLFEAIDFDFSPKTNRLHEMAESIFKEYPRKVGKKDGIEAILKAMKKKPVEFLREKTKDYATATTGQTKQYLPHPATWFNAERFNDDPEEWRQPSSQTSKPTAAVNTSTRIKGPETFI